MSLSFNDLPVDIISFSLDGFCVDVINVIKLSIDDVCVYCIVKSPKDVCVDGVAVSPNDVRLCCDDVSPKDVCVKGVVMVLNDMPADGNVESLNDLPV